jgi:hypothetical protein
MSDLPILPDWVLIEAAKRCGWADTLTIKYLQQSYGNTMFYRALCDMIAKHEQKPVDRKLLCAREACAEGYKSMADGYRTGVYDGQSPAKIAVRAIELWEQGFGE